MPESGARVVVKLRPEVQPPYVDHAEQFLPGWGALLAAFPPLELNRYYTAFDPNELLAQIAELQGQVAQVIPPLLSFFAIEPPPGVSAEFLASTLRFMTQFVADAYVEPEPAPALVNPGDDPLSLLQGYLLPAPAGIDATFAWTKPGGDGSGMQYVLIDQGWQLNHPDFSPPVQLIGTVNFPNGAEHGTQSLGVISMADNTTFGVGIAPRAVAKAVSTFRQVPFGGLVHDTANAILEAMKHLQRGDVILVEVALGIPGGPGCVPTLAAAPVEASEAIAAAVIWAVINGFVVIEPAGNGCINLDTWTNHLGRLPLNRAVADSGAVMVGAAQTPVLVPGQRPPRANFSCFGSRLDCFAWGANVVTTSLQPGGTSLFSGTSSASAIIAGAALSLQGMAKAKHGQPLTPIQLRSLLSDTFLNTSALDPANGFIGMMPDLKNLHFAL